MKKIVNEDEIAQVKERIENKISLGNIRGDILNKYGAFVDKCVLRYWLQKQWIDKDKKWDDFVNENFLQDFVDEDYNPKSFDASDIETEIKLIIQRGYRLQFTIKDEFSDDDKNNLKSIFNYFNLSEELA